MKKMFLMAACLFTLTAANAEAEENVIHECDYSTHESYPWYSMCNNEEKVVDGCLVIENTEEGKADWERQYFVDDQVPTVVGNDYTVRVTIKASAAGSLNCNMGDWSNQASGKIDFTTEWQTVDCKIVGVPATPSFVVFQSGSFVGTIYVSKVQIIEVVETNGEEKTPVTVVKFDFEDGEPLGGWGNGSTREVVDGSHDGSKCVMVTNPSEANSWECQMAIDVDEALTEGETYYLHFWAKASVEATVGAAYQNPENYSGRGDYPNFNLTTEWQEYTLKTVITGDNCKRLCFNLGKAAGQIYFDDIEIYYMKAVEGGGDEPGEDTGISAVKAGSKVAGQVYTIGGQPVKKASKGLYIVNGKKVVVK